MAAARSRAHLPQESRIARVRPNQIRVVLAMADSVKVIGRYQVIAPIGRGGMGTLYLARDPVLDRRVAIKVLRDHDDEGLRERFVREARTVAQLRHPNIVAIHDFGSFEHGLFIAMEYLEGETLAQIIRQRTPMLLRRKLEIMRDLCLGLAYAHDQGVIHRDVKPANVMVGVQGHVTILDFGIARLLNMSDESQGGVIVGTPAYLSPEQIQNSPVDQRADIFAAGAVLYELLTRQRPYSGEPFEVMKRILHDAPEPISSRLPGVDPELEMIVGRAMARQPADRYQDIAPMAADLDQVRNRLAADAVLEPAGVDEAPATDTDTRILDAPRPATPPAAVDGGNDTLFLVADTAAMGNPMPPVQLVVGRSGDSKRRGHVVPITATPFTIGRDSGCDLHLDDPMLSRRHAAIEYERGGFRLRELSSTNGAFVNGRRVKSGGAEPLVFGATIELGDSVLTFALVAETRLPDLTGCVIAGRYELRRLIRDSAKGAVYAAQDTRIPREVAVKLLSPELMRLDDYREQFDREAAVGATLHHPHICQVLDRGEEDVQPAGGPSLRLRYLCLEMMEGGSLQNRLREGPIPLEQIWRSVEQVADALDYAHRQGVVHGDVKPSAIVFGGDDHVYLTDFAFAQRALHATDGPSLGAPAYMAPEVWNHGDITAATDQFALAVVAYYAIARSLPFAGQESPAVRRTNFRQGPAPVHEEAAAARQEPVPRVASEVLARALAPDPAQRFASAGEFAAALTAALRGGRPDGATPHVFLSYQRDVSAGWANYFATQLKDQGIVTFMDVQRLDRAQQFPGRLSRAIEECDVFVCLLGATTLESAWVLEEIRQAHQHRKPMIPVFQERFDPAAPRHADPAVDALLSYDAVHLFDVRNVHVEHSASDLARLVRNTVAR